MPKIAWVTREGASCGVARLVFVILFLQVVVIFVYFVMNYFERVQKANFLFRIDRNIANCENKGNGLSQTLLENNYEDEGISEERWFKAELYRSILQVPG